MHERAGSGKRESRSRARNASSVATASKSSGTSMWRKRRAGALSSQRPTVVAATTVLRWKRSQRVGWATVAPARHRASSLAPWRSRLDRRLVRPIGVPLSAGRADGPVVEPAFQRFVRSVRIVAAQRGRNRRSVPFPTRPVLRGAPLWPGRRSAPPWRGQASGAMPAARRVDRRPSQGTVSGSGMGLRMAAVGAARCGLAASGAGARRERNAAD